MWTWLGIAVLARVLMASHESDQYQSTSSLSDQLGEDDDMEVELPTAGEESSRELLLGGAKPVVSSKNLRLQELEQEWKKKKNSKDYLSPYENSISNFIGELQSSKIPENSRKYIEDKRSATKQGDSAPSGSWMSWMTLENKAVPFRNLQDPWQEIKKSRAFSPWGGKRVTSFSQGPKVRRPIRVPFNSWGGKRSNSEEFEKRGRFSSWGGKRGWYYLGGDENLENFIEKRTKFNAWGGKRSKNGERDNDEEIKRNRFNAWGGKRSYKTEKRTPEEVGAKKRVFNAWGGKRFFTSDEASPGNEKGFNVRGDGDNMLKDEKPGDRSIELEDSVNNELVENGYDHDDIEIPLESEIIELQEKRGRSEAGAGAVARVGVGSEDYLHKSLFNPWGGKKRGENDLDEIGRGLNSILLPESNHHTRFWSWGG